MAEAWNDTLEEPGSNPLRAAKEAAGEKITPPGLPLPAKEHAKFITDDCIKVGSHP